MKILLAGPCQAEMEAWQSFLWDCGHVAVYARDGLECVAIARAFDPQIAIVDEDLLWGGIDGVRAEFEQDAALCDVPVLSLADAEQIDFEPKTFRCAHRQLPLRDLVQQIERVARQTSGLDGAAV